MFFGSSLKKKISRKWIIKIQLASDKKDKPFAVDNIQSLITNKIHLYCVSQNRHIGPISDWFYFDEENGA